MASAISAGVARPSPGTWFPDLVSLDELPVAVVNVPPMPVAE